jgi:DNA-binding NarL/FixJ family response regulator
MKIRVVIVEDHPIMREGVRLLLQEVPDLEIIGEADNGLDAVALAHGRSPDVVIMDVSMPKMGGVEATRRIKAANPGVKVIGLSAYANAVEMFSVGASGYVHKGASGQELVRAIRAVSDGARYMSPALKGVVPPARWD